jgi:hypothetical protein
MFGLINQLIDYQMARKGKESLMISYPMYCMIDASFGSLGPSISFCLVFSSRPVEFTSFLRQFTIASFLRRSQKPIMPHGDFSDYAAFTHLALGIASIAAPQYLWFSGIGPLGPMLTGEPTAAALSMARFAGGPFIFFALTLFVVRWNKINGISDFVLLLCTVDCRYANAQLMRQSCWI